ncbi:MAG: HNH endonuclease [Bdellovibrionales bacterium]
MSNRPPTFKPNMGLQAVPKMAYSPPEDTTPKHRIYNQQWRDLRADHLRKNPLCVFCQKEGKVVVARIVDHIIPHKGNRTLLFDPTNLQSLCKHHHDADKQLIERGKRKRRCGVDGMPIVSDS